MRGTRFRSYWPKSRRGWFWDQCETSLRNEFGTSYCSRLMVKTVLETVLDQTIAGDCDSRVRTKNCSMFT